LKNNIKATTKPAKWEDKLLYCQASLVIENKNKFKRDKGLRFLSKDKGVDLANIMTLKSFFMAHNRDP